MNIVLIGFRCTGKTTAGKALGDRLRREFVDSDHFIERKTGLTVRDLFRSRGESSFRQIESDTLNELSKMDNKVIAAGGGAVLWYKNIRNLKRNGVLFLLEADLETIWDRFQADPRTPTQRPPLTHLDDVRREIQEQLEIRRPYYQKAADHVIDTGARGVDDVVQEIMRYLEDKEILGRIL